jgi:hypothetical protein
MIAERRTGKRGREGDPVSFHSLTCDEAMDVLAHPGKTDRTTEADPQFDQEEGPDCHGELAAAVAALPEALNLVLGPAVLRPIL